LGTRLNELIIHRAAVPEDLSAMLGDLPVVWLKENEPSTEEWRAMRSHGVDVLLALLPLAIPTAAGADLPVWYFDVQGQSLSPTGLPKFARWMMQPPPSTVWLRCSSSGQRVSATFTTRTNTDGVDMDALLLGSAWLPVEMRRTWDASNIERGNTDDPPAKESSLLSLLFLWLGSEMRAATSGKPRPVHAGEWNIGIFPNPIQSLLDEEHNTNVRWLTSPSPGTHRLEPFGYKAADGQLNVLYRKMDRLGGTDTIARVRPKNDGNLKRSRTMLSAQAALSYPFVLQRGADTYAIVSYPHQQRTELFRVTEANDGLDHVKTLLDVALINPTGVEHQGRWWILGSDVDAPDGVLRAYHAPAFDGPYTAHASNPVRISGTGCRPAGTMFVDAGVLWRPSLDNTDPRAPAVIFNRIIELSPTGFHEEPGRTLTGFAGSVYGNGVSTICTMGDITIVDGLRHAPEAREIGPSERSPNRRSKAYEE
ncbi:MAG: glucosamine inositolphosphorylceramide transferase family protein, partial [Flavobacteriales bacterium]